MNDSPRPGVLMVTGAYWPELSGGGLQARTIIHALRDAFTFGVLTTCTDERLARDSEVEGVPVHRLFVDVSRPVTKIAAMLGMAGYFVHHSARFEIVHLHGFSQKSIAVVLLAMLFRKRIAITIHTAGHDDPQGVRRQGALAYWCYKRADVFLAISRGMAENYRAAGLPEARLRTVPNGVDTGRFRPPTPEERAAARRSFGLRDDVRWVMFAGLFTRDKCPDVLFDAWLRLQDGPVKTGLLMVGATESAYYEVDETVARDIEANARSRGLDPLVKFTGAIPDIERAFHAADVFAMPSAREAFGMVLVEAMACALPVVASHISGVTDEIVDDQRTGLLVRPRDAAALADALRRLLEDTTDTREMREQARDAVVRRFGLTAARQRWRDAYNAARGC